MYYVVPLTVWTSASDVGSGVKLVDEIITTRRDEIRGLPGQDGQDAPQSGGHWKTDDVGYFTPDPTSDALVHTVIHVLCCSSDSVDQCI
jgi:hypothetical protein